MVRLAIWNVYFGRHLPLILEGLHELRPFDVLLLQELSQHAGTLDADRIAAHLGSGWRAAQATAQLLRGQHQANGFVWNSRRVNALHVTSIGLPTPSGRAMRRLPPSQRNAIVMDARVDGRRVRLYSVHLDVFGIAHKHAQFAYVLADAHRRGQADLTVIGGDMNTYGIGGRPRWGELRRLAEEAGFSELTVGIGWTHRGLGVRQKLDAIFASPAHLPYHCRRVIVPGSDHVPIWVDLRRLEVD